jgi:hypothetical protein
MITLEYKPFENKEWFADNHNWIFSKFYKLLKKEKYKKLIDECFNDHEIEYSEDYIYQFELDIINNRKDILSLLKSVKKEYELNIE